MSIMKRLRDETKADHEHLETFPYFKALAEHTLPLDCYVNQLRGLAIIHGVLENELATIQEKPVADVWNNGLRKLPLLEQDLEFFKPRVDSDYMPAIDAALAMTEHIRLRRIESPETLLGYLYVFEGSTLGNRMHQPDITATFHLDGSTGSRYYESYGDQVPEKWQQFSEKMNTALSDPSLHDPVIKAAHEAFSGLEALYKVLFPMKKQEKNIHVTRINPEAGNHPIPDDEREIAAALAASDRTWAEFPYYEARYGSRGKRFSDSDACWLVTLTSLDHDGLEKQMDWLGRVLATRGMPLILLERILFYLYEELVKAIPDKTSAYAGLLRAADTFAKKRTACISEKQFEMLAREFDEMVGITLAKQYKNTGRLLAAAVTDEKNGIAGAVSAISDWLTATDRFPEKWITAVKNIVQKAGKEARS
jgi:heme oxygenase